MGPESVRLKGYVCCKLAYLSDDNSAFDFHLFTLVGRLTATNCKLRICEVFSTLHWPLVAFSSHVVSHPSEP